MIVEIWGSCFVLLALNSHYGNNLPTQTLGKFGLGLKPRVVERVSGGILETRCPFSSLLVRRILLLLLEHRMGRGLAEASLGVAQGVALVSLLASLCCQYAFQIFLTHRMASY